VAVVADGEGASAQAAPYNLLAKQLRAESTHAQNVCDGVGVPAFGEHGYGDDAPNVFAEPARFADRVHDLTHEVFIG
jgi:hypothetical protein